MGGYHLFLTDKHGHSIMDIAKEFAATSTSLEIVNKLRQHFPELTLIEAKEIMIITTTPYKSLEEYQENLFNDLEKDATDDSNING